MRDAGFPVIPVPSFGGRRGGVRGGLDADAFCLPVSSNKAKHAGSGCGARGHRRGLVLYEAPHRVRAVDDLLAVLGRTAFWSSRAS
jgi:hypothetical protein